MPSGYVARTPTDMLVDTGILKVGAVGAATTILGVSRGGLQFDPGTTIREAEFDGRRSPTMGLDRKSFIRPKITGTMLQLAQEDIAIFDAGASVASAGIPLVHTITPKAADAFLVEADYRKVELVYNRAGGGTVTIAFDRALFTKYGPITGTDANEAEIPVEIEARGNPSALTGAPYTILVADPA